MFGKTIHMVGDNLHPAQLSVLKAAVRSKAKYKLYLMGRGWGKTVLERNKVWNDLSIDGATCRGVKPIYGLFTPTATLNMQMYDTMSMAKQVIAKHKQGQIIYKNGIKLLFKSFHEPELLRGQNFYKRIYVDEAALINDESFLYIMKDVFKWAEEVNLFTTPRGINWIKTNIADKAETEPDLYAVFRGTSLDNPFLDIRERNELEKILASGTIPNSVKQENLAEFIDAGGLVFPGLQKCLKNEGMMPITGQNFVGIDLGEVSDFSCVVILNNRGQLVSYNRFNKVDYNTQRKLIADILGRKNVRGFIDAAGIGKDIGRWLREQGFGVYDFTFTNSTKNNLIETLQRQIALERISLPYATQIPTLIKEMNSFRYAISHSGTIVYGGNNKRDDSVIALALATKAFYQAKN